MKRLIELDFLRGIAIILVLFRHIPLTPYTQNMGWIGVDLFFVLSGFLVSGLLFKEFLKYGNINAKLFLIRRGFKIYPIYYLSLPLYLIPKAMNGNFSWSQVFPEIFFIQNYTSGWGYAYPATWSLAIEEHFYFGLVFAILFVIKIKPTFLNMNNSISILKNKVVISIVLLLLVILAMRILHHQFSGALPAKAITMTHLRIDSLLFGVLIAYMFYFDSERFHNFFAKLKGLLLIIFILGISWTPFVSLFHANVVTFGFSVLYFSFGALLILFLVKQNIADTLKSIFSAPVVSIISKIGYASFSIYVIHTLVITLLHYLFAYVHLDNKFLFFVVASTASVIVGVFMTSYIEAYFLKMRNKMYPNRI